MKNISKPVFVDHISSYRFDAPGFPCPLQYFSLLRDSEVVTFTTSEGMRYEMPKDSLVGDRPIEDELTEICKVLLEKPKLDLTVFWDAATSVKPRSIRDTFFHLAEEVGEVSTCIHRPHKAEEPLVGELADVLNCTLDIFQNHYGPDWDLLQLQMDKKCTKWKGVQS